MVPDIRLDVVPVAFRLAINGRPSEAPLGELLAAGAPAGAGEAEDPPDDPDAHAARANARARNGRERM
jgi:hypothetical protein